MKKPGSSKSQEITEAAKIIKRGGVVIFPTDTVYGIGAIFSDKKAVEKIYKIKGTLKTQPFPVLVAGVGQAEKIVHMNEIARELAEKYWPGGLTIIAKNKNSQGKTGVRQPDHIVPLTLIEKAKTPIIGTSANFHGQKTPANMGELDTDFAKLADFVILGECKNKKESTVVDTTVEPFKILRQGSVKI